MYYELSVSNRIGKSVYSRPPPHSIEGMTLAAKLRLKSIKSNSKLKSVYTYIINENLNLL